MDYIDRLIIGQLPQPRLNSFRLQRSVCVLANLAIVALFAAGYSRPAIAQLMEFDTNRISVAGDKFSGTVQAAVAFKIRASKKRLTSHIEIALGALQSSDNTRAFVSLGPVWHWPVRNRATFFELGFSPTLIGGSAFDGRDLGGSFHFTSSVTMGAQFGDDGRSILALRVQHISNGGLHNTNPGMDSVGLNFSHNFDR